MFDSSNITGLYKPSTSMLLDWINWEYNYDI